MIAHVEVDGVDGRRAALHGARGHFREFAGAAGGEEQPGSLGGEGESSGCADAGAGSGDKDDLSLEAHDTILANVLGMGDVRDGKLTSESRSDYARFGCLYSADAH